MFCVVGGVVLCLVVSLIWCCVIVCVVVWGFEVMCCNVSSGIEVLRLVVFHQQCKIE